MLDSLTPANIVVKIGSLKHSDIENPSMAKEKKTKAVATLLSNQEYKSTLAELKKKIQESQLRAITAVNKELIRTVGKRFTE